MESTRMVPPSKKKLTTADMARTETLARDEEFTGRKSADNEPMESRAEMHRTPQSTQDEKPSPLLAEDREKDFRARWQSIQTEFVDEPRRAVEQADELVAEIMQQLAQSFSDQRSRLESEWGHSDRASTEDLRLALRRYRSFFDRLLSF